MAMPLAPARLVEPQTAAELRHPRTAGDLVVALPAEGGLQLFARRHGGMLRGQHVVDLLFIGYEVSDAESGR